MIGPAEIEDMLADYEEAMNNSGVGLPPGEVSWPVTLPGHHPLHFPRMKPRSVSA
jgi:hypothetical protein